MYWPTYALSILNRFTKNLLRLLPINLAYKQCLTVYCSQFFPIHNSDDSFQFNISWECRLDVNILKSEHQHIQKWFNQSVSYDCRFVWFYGLIFEEKKCDWCAFRCGGRNVKHRHSGFELQNEWNEPAIWWNSLSQKRFSYQSGRCFADWASKNLNKPHISIVTMTRLILKI